MAEKTRYSDAELEEFRAIILEKLEVAKKDYELLRSGVTNSDGTMWLIHHQHLRCWKKVPQLCRRKRPDVWHNAR